MRRSMEQDCSKKEKISAYIRVLSLSIYSLAGLKKNNLIIPSHYYYLEVLLVPFPTDISRI